LWRRCGRHSRVAHRLLSRFLRAARYRTRELPSPSPWSYDSAPRAPLTAAYIARFEIARRSPLVRAVEVQAVNILAACFHGPDADHIGGFLDVFDAFEVDSVYVSGDPKGTLTYNTFLRGVRYEGSELEVVRAGRR
jgi:hypothetical protein